MSRRAVVTIGLGFGDEGKGACVDYLCRQLKADLVVRYCGGCQAGHNVELPWGTRHTFSQFGAGTFSGVPTYLGPDVIISPLAMDNEAHHLIDVGIADPWPLLKIDKNCLVATPYHSELNRYRETVRGVRRHGSCGEGIGATREHSLACPDQALRAGDLCGDGDGDIVIAKLKEIQAWADGEGRREEGAVAGDRIVDHIDPEDLYHRLMASTWFTVVDKMPNFEMAVF
jgi:adenylosuccinate synthase